MNTLRITPHTDAIADHRLLLSWCGNCSALNFPPRAVCTECGEAGEPVWKEATGLGTLWSFSTFHKRYDDSFPLPVPYTVAVIELDEGSKIYTNIVRSRPSELQIGMSMRAEFTELAPGRTGLTFAPTTKDL